MTSEEGIHSEDPGGSVTDFDRTRRYFIDALVFGFAVLGLPLILVSVLRAAEFGWKPAMTFHVAFYFINLLHLGFRNHISYGVRSGISVGLTFIVGCAGLWTWGLIGLGLPILILAIGFATVLRGTRDALLTALAAAVYIAVLGVLANSGRFVFAVDFNEYAVEVTPWIAACIGTALVAVMLILLLDRVQGALQHSIQTLSTRTAALEDANRRLEDANRRLEFEIDDRKRSEARLRLLSSAVEQSGEGLAVIDRAENILFTNEAFAVMHGYTPGELLGKHISVFHAPDQMASVAEANRIIRETGSFRGEVKHARRDGSTFPTLMNNALLRDESGEPFGIVGTVRDISDIKEAEESVAERLEFEMLLSELSAALINLPSSAFDAEITRSLQRIVEFLGIDRSSLFLLTGAGQELLTTHSYSRPGFAQSTAMTEPHRFPWSAQRLTRGEVIALYRLPEDLPEEAAAEREYCQNSGLKSNLIVPITAGGSAFAAMSFGSFTEHRTWPEELIPRLRLVGEIFANAVMRRQNEEALRSERDTLRALMDGLARTGIGVDIVRADHVILFQNQTLLDGFGDRVGQCCHESYVGIPDPCDPCPMIKALETNSVQNVELNLPNGKSFEILAAPLPSQDGTVDRAIEVVLDVTERKHAERERRALECQLQHAHRLESLGVLAGGIAHDFNNLLAAIMGNTDLAMGDVPRDSETYACLEEVRAAGQRAKELIQQILAFSRREDQNRKPLRAQTVLKEALKLLRGSLPTTIELRLDIDPSCGMILADPTQVHQIVMNLCANAYHAMRERGGVLSVSLAPVTLSEEEAERHVDLCPGEYTRLVVSDTGHGMDEATQQRIFEPYFTTKEKSEGTGLGLATVHGIVTHWGGGITVESETEKGATVTVLFPVCQDAATDMRSGAETDDAIPTGTERVLLVDDDEAVVRFESRMLTRWGYDVTSCHNSFDAFDAFRLSPGTFDIVITDYTMPMMTGIDLSKELLQIRPDIPILLCTGFSEMVDESVAKDAGVREFLMKPVTPYDLAHAIRRLAQPHASPSA